ncbi:MAG: hypothetical protein Q4F78_08680 [Bacillota bacterium]|nr:hypothetical protein [Bacillota bacterium]
MKKLIVILTVMCMVLTSMVVPMVAFGINDEEVTQQGATSDFNIDPFGGNLKYLDLDGNEVVNTDQSAAGGTFDCGKKVGEQLSKIGATDIKDPVGNNDTGAFKCWYRIVKSEDGSFGIDFNDGQPKEYTTEQVKEFNVDEFWNGYIKFVAKWEEIPLDVYKNEFEKNNGDNGGGGMEGPVVPCKVQVTGPGQSGESESEMFPDEPFEFECAEGDLVTMSVDVTGINEFAGASFSWFKFVFPNDPENNTNVQEIDLEVYTDTYSTAENGIDGDDIDNCMYVCRISTQSNGMYTYRFAPRTTVNDDGDGYRTVPEDMIQVEYNYCNADGIYEYIAVAIAIDEDYTYGELIAREEAKLNHYDGLGEVTYSYENGSFSDGENWNQEMLNEKATKGGLWLNSYIYYEKILFNTEVRYYDENGNYIINEEKIIIPRGSTYNDVLSKMDVPKDNEMNAIDNNRYGFDGWFYSVDARGMDSMDSMDLIVNEGNAWLIVEAKYRKKPITIKYSYPVSDGQGGFVAKTKTIECLVSTDGTESNDAKKLINICKALDCNDAILEETHYNTWHVSDNASVNRDGNPLPLVREIHVAAIDNTTNYIPVFADRNFLEKKNGFYDLENEITVYYVEAKTDFEGTLDRESLTEAVGVEATNRYDNQGEELVLNRYITDGPSWDYGPMDTPNPAPGEELGGFVMGYNCIVRPYYNKILIDLKWAENGENKREQILTEPCDYTLPQKNNHIQFWDVCGDRFGGMYCMSGSEIPVTEKEYAPCLLLESRYSLDINELEKADGQTNEEFVEIKLMLKEKALKDTNFVEAKTQMKYLDVELNKRNENGGWQQVHDGEFPAEGLELILPYPEGTSAATHKFSVTHLISSSNHPGKDKGDVEVLEVEELEEGLRVVVRSLSPIAIAYEEGEDGFGAFFVDSNGGTMPVSGVDEGGNPYPPQESAFWDYQYGKTEACTFVDLLDEESIEMLEAITKENSVLKGWKLYYGSSFDLAYEEKPEVNDSFTNIHHTDRFWDEYLLISNQTELPKSDGNLYTLNELYQVSCQKPILYAVAQWIEVAAPEEAEATINTSEAKIKEVKDVLAQVEVTEDVSVKVADAAVEKAIEEAIEGEQTVTITTTPIAEPVEEEDVVAKFGKDNVEKVEGTKAKDTDEIAQFLDLSVLIEVKVNSEVKAKGEVSELSNPITFTIDIPEYLLDIAKSFYIIRVHNGKSDIIAPDSVKDSKLSFKTDKFSTYALAYEPKPINNNQGGGTTPGGPNNPIQPGTPGTSGGPGIAAPTPDMAVDTGDDFSAIPYIAVMAIAIAGAAVAVFRRRSVK